MEWFSTRLCAFRSLCIIYLTVFLGGLCAISVFAQQPLKTLIVDVDHRPATSLDGNWHYLVDPTGRSLYTPDGAVRDNGYALNEHPTLVGERKGQEYDFARASTVAATPRRTASLRARVSSGAGSNDARAASSIMVP